MGESKPDKRIDAAMDGEDASFGEDLLVAIRENWRAAEKAGKRDIAILMASALLAWLLTSATTDGLALSIAGISLDRPDVLLSLLPLVAAYATISVCGSFTNLAVYLLYHVVLFEKLHPKARENFVDTLVMPGDSAFIANLSGALLRGRRVYVTMSLARVYAVPIFIAALDAFIVWASLSTQVTPIALGIGVVSSALSLLALGTVVLLLFGGDFDYE